MKVLLCYNEYQSVSGETAFFRNLREGLDRRGLDYDVCPVRQGPMDSLAGRLERYSRFPLLRDTERALKRHKGYDVLHFLNAAQAPAGRGIAKPKMATSHFFLDSYLESSPSGILMRPLEHLYRAYVGMLDRGAFLDLDRLVASAPYQARRIEERYGLADLPVIYPGVDIAHLRGVEKRDLRAEHDAGSVVVYLGRLDERSKGVSYLIRAMRHLGPDTKLLLAGDGPDRERYRRLASGDDRIAFLGELSWEEKCAVHKSADVVAMPSLYEVFGTVFAESLACDVPVVAFDLPFWEGLYEGAGIFVERNPASLAGGIASALDDSGLRRRVVSAGRRLVERYDMSRTASDYARLYAELAEVF